jgi:hypothetical protein
MYILHKKIVGCPVAIRGMERRPTSFDVAVAGAGPRRIEETLEANPQFAKISLDDSESLKSSMLSELKELQRVDRVLCTTFWKIRAKDRMRAPESHRPMVADGLNSVKVDRSGQPSWRTGVGMLGWITKDQDCRTGGKTERGLGNKSLLREYWLPLLYIGATPVMWGCSGDRMTI